MVSSLRKFCAFALFLPFCLSQTPAFGANEPTATPAPVRATSLGYAIDAQPIGENLCALTFDDGPGPTTTPQLLKTLDKYGIPATFFVLGQNAHFAPELVKQEIAEGHEVGVHTYTHANLKAVSSDRRRNEIVRSLELLKSLGVDPKVLRPPYGNRNAEIDKLVNEFGMEVILWSHDTLDWKRLPEDYGKLASGVKGVAAPGRMHGIILMHDIHQRSVDDVPRAIEQLKAAGCQRFVTVSDYLDTLFNDPEPSFLMTRRPVVAEAPKASAQPATEAAAAQASSQPVAEASQPLLKVSSPHIVAEETEKRAPHHIMVNAPQEAGKASSQHLSAQEEAAKLAAQHSLSASPREVVTVSLQEVLAGESKDLLTISLQDVLVDTPHDAVKLAKDSSPDIVVPKELMTPSAQKPVVESPQEAGKASPQHIVAEAAQAPATPSAQETVVKTHKNVVTGSLQGVSSEAPHELSQASMPKVEKKSYPPIPKVQVGSVAPKILASQHDIAPRMVGTDFVADEEGKKTQLRPWSGFVGDDLSLRPAKLVPVHEEAKTSSLMDSIKRFF